MQYKHFGSQVILQFYIFLSGEQHLLQHTRQEVQRQYRKPGSASKMILFQTGQLEEGVVRCWCGSLFGFQIKHNPDMTNGHPGKW
ncbi:hypothetical protein T10_12877 [Trichinella papuae]|uniref:Uncharacterized protein n=1 Tax=Trichinella papuae TaxID=268474 RepID=A0A0V1ML79_9BILA|nr:hypothetical protein T10_12877 [Trichinella papuae]